MSEYLAATEDIVLPTERRTVVLASGLAASAAMFSGPERPTKKTEQPVR